MSNAWIKIHDGLTDDPKHRERMGIRLWFYMWLVKKADWLTGVVYSYTDRWASDELGMPERTVEGQRQRLIADGYIMSHPDFQCQHIRIMRWRNPKLVNPPQVNIPGDESSYVKLRTHGTQSYVPIASQSYVPPTLYSDRSDSTTCPVGNGDRPEIFAVYERNIGPLTPIIADDLNDWLETVPEEWIESAIQIAALQNKRRMSYISGILRRYQAEGYDGGPDAQKERGSNLHPGDDTWSDD